MSIFCSHVCTCSLPDTTHAPVSDSRPRSTHLPRDRVLSLHTWALMDACNKRRALPHVYIAFVVNTIQQPHLTTVLQHFVGKCLLLELNSYTCKKGGMEKLKEVLGVQAANDLKKKHATPIIQPSPPACTPDPPTTLHRHKVCHLLSHKQHLPVSSALFISFPT